MRKDELIYQLEKITGNPLVVMHIGGEFLEIKEVQPIADNLMITLKD